jgi:hypothetical protein
MLPPVTLITEFGPRLVKPIVDHPDYWIGRDGCVYSTKLKKQPAKRLHMSPPRKAGASPVIGLARRSGRRTTKSLLRLVAAYWLEPPPDLLAVPQLIHGGPPAEWRKDDYSADNVQWFVPHKGVVDVKSETVEEALARGVKVERCPAKAAAGSMIDWRFLK